jgi:hypothetical protein
MKNPVFKFFALLFFGVLLLAGVFFFKLFSAAAQAQGGNPLFPPEMNAAKYARQEFVIGDLGGVPVRIPHYFANYVEYDGDPGFGEKRKGPVPERTYQSKLASFGFKVRFPDMAGLSSPEMWKDYEKYRDYNWKDYYDPIKSITPWIGVGFDAGSRYSGDGLLEYRVNAKLSFNAEKEGYQALSYKNYEKLAKTEHGLTVYAPPGIDPKTKKPYRQDDDAEDLFVHRDKSGKVDAYIECSNRNLNNFKFSPCTQHISMEPRMRTEIYISYTRHHLPHWQQIQRNVSELVWSFRTDAAELPAMSASAPGAQR